MYIGLTADHSSVIRRLATKFQRPILREDLVTQRERKATKKVCGVLGKENGASVQRLWE